MGGKNLFFSRKFQRLIFKMSRFFGRNWLLLSLHLQWPEYPGLLWRISLCSQRAEWFHTHPTHVVVPVWDFSSPCQSINWKCVNAPLYFYIVSCVVQSLKGWWKRSYFLQQILFLIVWNIWRNNLSKEPGQCCHDFCVTPTTSIHTQSVQSCFFSKEKGFFLFLQEQLYE